SPNRSFYATKDPRYYTLTKKDHIPPFLLSIFLPILHLKKLLSSNTSFHSIAILCHLDPLSLPSKNIDDLKQEESLHSQYSSSRNPPPTQNPIHHHHHSGFSPS